MVFGLKNGLTFESQYILSTMNESALSGNTDSLPIRLNINAFENTQSSDGHQANKLPNMHQTPLISSNLRTPMRVQVEYPDSISRKRKHQISNNFQQPQKKINSVNSMTIIEQFREECLEDDVLLSQIADVHVNEEPVETDTNCHLSHGLSDTARVFARCFSLPIEESAKKGKVLVYDSDGLVDDSD